MTHLLSRIAIGLVLLSSQAGLTHAITISSEPAAGDARLVHGEMLADLYVDPTDHAVVRIATRLLAEDIERVTGRKPRVVHRNERLTSHAVVIGTLGHSRIIDRLAGSGKLDVKPIRGKWESFVLQVVSDPLPGVETALVIAGSDRRGTAFGVFELSERIGVSPWYFWADVSSQQRDAIVIKSAAYHFGPPSVKYRGIFINDEDWGLHPWAAKTFDPQQGDIGPKTYEKVYELLLRLKGNYLWPAMHGCTIEFGKIPENVKLADEWAIVMGAAHCEPLNRNNVWWKQDGKGEWRYDTNRKNMLAYWEEWARYRGDYEAVWTVGMRGIHDTGMAGPSDINEQVKLLEQAIADQRELLRKHVSRDVENVPQVFTPYKEALTHYQHGLRLPDDVTILWCEDNYGYIRQLSSPQEQQRSGGSGVYYHISYLGWPRPYLWLNTTPPALMWQEMSKAYAYGADRIWVLNVGDIKPGEIGTDFWLRMAWDVQQWDQSNVNDFLESFAARTFGQEHATEIRQILAEFYRLGFVRKPELMDDDLFSLVHYREAERILEQHRAVLERAEAVNSSMPDRLKDAYYQLVLYPVRISTATAETFINADFNRLYAQQGRAVANDFARQSADAIKRMEAETAYYNNELAGGKWKHMMTLKGIGGNWNVQWPATAQLQPLGQPAMGVVVEGSGIPLLPGTGDSAARGMMVDLPAAAGEFESPFELRRDGDVEYLVVPNKEPGRSSGNTLTPGAGPKATYRFTIPRAGRYNLFMQVNCPTNEDDSWFIKLNDGQWQTWNDVTTRTPWDWRKQGTYELDAGEHTLTIAQREDGAMFSRIRFTDRPSAPTLEELYPGQEPDLLPVFSRFASEPRFIELFNLGAASFKFTAAADQPWIKLSQSSGTVDGQTRLWVSVDWNNAPQTGRHSGTVRITGAGTEQRVRVVLLNPDADNPAPFVERDGYVAIEAENFTRSIERNGVKWDVIRDLGRVGDSVAVFPVTAPSINDASQIPQRSPVLEYDLTLLTSGQVQLTTYCLPTHRIHEGRGLRYAISVGDEPPQVVDFYESGGHGGENSPRWRDNVSRNAAINTTTHHVAKPGRHTVRLWMVDPGVVVDRMVLDLGGLRPSYLGPPQTKAGKPD